MNTQFKVKFLQHLNNKKANKGFTLIELLVVVIIIGVLAAIALPNLLNQVAKGRQAEAKTNLGAINRAQQAYRLEEATFAPKVTDLPVKFSWQYYDLSDVGTGTRTFASYTSAAKTQFADDILDYQAGANQTTDGVFNAVICEQQGLTGAAPGVNTAATDCTAGKKVIK